MKNQRLNNSSLIDHFFMEGVREIIGQDDYQKVVNRLPADCSQANWEDNLGCQLEALFGERGSQGIAMRAGRAAFHYAFRKNAGELGLTTTDVRFLPVPLKMKTTLNAFATWLTLSGGENYEVCEDERCWCLNSSAKIPNATSTHFALGFLQELANWASRGKIYRVYEKKPMSPDSSVRSFLIEKLPIE
jgi:hypothetical protein